MGSSSSVQEVPSGVERGLGPSFMKNQFRLVPQSERERLLIKEKKQTKIKVKINK